jgi:hypothetical protein
MGGVGVRASGGGAAGVTALVAGRVGREALTGIALRRRGPHEMLTAP